MKTTKDKKYGSCIVVAFLSYSVAVLPVSAGCYKNGEGDPLGLTRFDGHLGGGALTESAHEQAQDC
jgi:hypothetical protein